MGKTNRQKASLREERLKQLSTRERLRREVTKKKLEKRVLNSNERRFLEMNGPKGELVRAWEELRITPNRAQEKLEQVRQGNTSETGSPIVSDATVENRERTEAVKRVLDLINAQWPNVLRTPVGSRVFQSCIKYASDEQRLAVVEKLKGDSSDSTPLLVTLCCDGYAHHAVLSIIRHGFREVVRTLHSVICPCASILATTRHGLVVLQACYSSSQLSVENRRFLTLRCLKIQTPLLSSLEGFPDLVNMTRLMKEAHGLDILYVPLERLCAKLVSRPDDYPASYSLVHFILLAMVPCLKPGDTATEFQRFVRKNFSSLLQPKNLHGAILAERAIAITPPRYRKMFLVILRELFLELALAPNTAPLIARMFDYVYDEAIANKYLVTPLKENIVDIASSPHGSRILLHLLTPTCENRASLFFPFWSEFNLYSQHNLDWNKTPSRELYNPQREIQERETKQTKTDEEFEHGQTIPKSAAVSHQKHILTIIKELIAVLPDVIAKVKDAGVLSLIASHVSRFDDGKLLQQLEKEERMRIQDLRNTIRTASRTKRNRDEPKT